MLRRCATAALLAVALCTSACTGGDEQAAAPPPPAAGGSEGAGSSTTPVSTPGAATAASEEPVLARRDGSIDQEPVTAEVVRLQRDGRVANLSVRFTTTSDTDAQITDSLSDDIDQPVAGSDDTTQGYDSFDGPQLVDQQNGKLHLVARDPTGTCVCDTGLSSRFVAADAPVVLSATFGAPPAGVRTMDVRLPGFGTFDDVPVA